jgi:hypothetical protein
MPANLSPVKRVMATAAILELNLNLACCPVLDLKLVEILLHTFRRLQLVIPFCTQSHDSLRSLKPVHPTTVFGLLSHSMK